MTEIAQIPETSGQNRLDAAAKIISSSIGWSAATGAIPIPLVDMAALAAVQANMISKISRLYGESLSTEAARSIIAVMLGTLLPAGVANSFMRMSIKVLPGAGYLIGTASMMALSAAGTYAIGKVFIGHFEKGGTLSNFDPESIKEQLKKEYDDAKLSGKGVAKTAA
ncbi:MAG: DUF697 domain-containing protein [Rhodospirillaceae bacterium]|nr:DUF697 domain-containing protein [Rhodospirillales bacterium]